MKSIVKWPRFLTEKREKGQSLVIVALAMMAIIAITGLAIDVAIIMQARRDLVAITDATALAAASELTADASVSDATRQGYATQRATEYAKLNGFDPTATGNSMSVTFPTSSPVRKLVEVQSTRAVNTSFMKVFGIDTVNISSSARQGESAPLDIVLLMDVSASQAEQNYKAELSSPSGWDTVCINPANGQTATSCWYDPTKPTRDNPSTFTWPPQVGDANNPNMPWKPFKDQQAAARYFVSLLDSRYDQVALVSFSSKVSTSDTPYPGGYPDEAVKQIGLTNNFTSVQDKIGYSPSTEGEKGTLGLFPAGQTNMAKGIQVALNTLQTDTNARANAVGVIILLSDGSPTRTLAGVSGSCSSSSPQNCVAQRTDVKTQVEIAAQKRVVIYTVFCGSATFAAKHALTLQWIADKTDNAVLDNTYSAPYNFPTGYQGYDATWFKNNVSSNYYLAGDAASLYDAYNDIFHKIYTRLVQ